MYISGDSTNFENRLHQFANTTGDIMNYRIEGSGYLSSWSANFKRKLSKEVKVKYAQHGIYPIQTFFY
jgi:hypothetical protein